MSDDKRKVLEMLEAGKISKEDAGRLLTALGENDDAFSEKDMSPNSAIQQNIPQLTLQPEIPQMPEYDTDGDARDEAPEDNSEGYECCAAANSFDEIETLNIEWVNGPVEIYCGNGDTVKITEYSKRPLKDGEHLELDEDDGEISIRFSGKAGKRGISGMLGFVKLSKRLVVELPRSFEGFDSLNITNVSGDITVNGLSADESEISSVSGRLSVSELRGESLSLSTVSGWLCAANVFAEELSISSVSGKVEINGFNAEDASLGTVSGKLTAEGCAENITLNTTSGEQILRLNGSAEEIRTNSVSGSTRLYIPDNPAGFEVSYNSVSGGLSSEFPLTFEDGKMNKKSGKGFYGQGETEIGMNSMSGALSLCKA